MNRRILRSIPVGVTTLALLAAPAIHASPAPPEPTLEEPVPESFDETVEVTEVLLDALVTDREGNVVVGLTPDDFIVEENGNPIEVSAAYFYSNLELVESAAGEDTGGSGVLPGTSASDRYFILFFHDQRRGSTRLAKQQILAAKEAKEWIERGREFSDYVAVASFGSRLEIHQDFTQSTPDLVRAVDRAAISKKESNEWSTRRGESAADVPSLISQLPEGKKLGKKSRDIEDALVLLSEASRPIVGRKNLILFTSGFGKIDPFGRYLPGDRDIERVKESFNSSNIAAYPIETTPDNTEHPLRNALHEIADSTSGRLYYNFTRFGTPMQAIADSTTGYYLLAYSSEIAEGRDDFREVDVRLRNPEFRVSARRGYSALTND